MASLPLCTSSTRSSQRSLGSANDLTFEEVSLSSAASLPDERGGEKITFLVLIMAELLHAILQDLPPELTRHTIDESPDLVRVLYESIRSALDLAGYKKNDSTPVFKHVQAARDSGPLANHLIECIAWFLDCDIYELDSNGSLRRLHLDFDVPPPDVPHDLDDAAT